MRLKTKIIFFVILFIGIILIPMNCHAAISINDARRAAVQVAEEILTVGKKVDIYYDEEKGNKGLTWNLYNGKLCFFCHSFTSYVYKHIIGLPDSYTNKNEGKDSSEFYSRVSDLNDFDNVMITVNGKTVRWFKRISRGEAQPGDMIVYIATRDFRENGCFR